MKKGIVIYGFPCIGKSTLCEGKEDEGIFLDLESSDYQWIFSDEQKSMTAEERKGIYKQKNPEWPQNYADAIIEKRKKYDYIFVSFEGKNQCIKHGIPYWIIFPNYECKDEYIRRMRVRGNPEEFVQKIASNFDEFVKGCYDDTNAERKIILKKGEFLADIIGKFD